jgi:hypothetical protein
MIRREQIQKLKEERQAAIDAALEREKLRDNDLGMARMVSLLQITFI